MYNKFVILDIKLCFTNDKSDLCQNTEKFQNIMTSLVDKTSTIKQNSTRYYLLNWVCKCVQLNSKVVNIFQCLHAQQLCTVFKILYVRQFLLYLLPHAFCLCARQYDTISSHLTQIFMCGTGNVKTMLLDFFCLCRSN